MQQNHPAFKEAESENAIKSWLKYANDRDGGGICRAERKEGVLGKSNVLLFYIY